ncbi:MAG TPA: hypothetical protein VJ654_00950 [Noviherbaspirillum sp.]|nr:hypothetical protein [Noviherbaspirillum sp.]
MTNLLDTSIRLNIKPLALALIAAGILSACGGGGGGDKTAATPNGGVTSPGTTNPGTTPDPTNPGTTPGTTTIPAPVNASASTVMTCPEGAGYQCSGESIIRSDNGVALTSSGVQVYGISTSDLDPSNPNPASASGFALPSSTTPPGTAEIRLAKAPNSAAVASAALLLSNFGISWNGKDERPQTIETFRPVPRRIELGANRVVSVVNLPPYTDTGFYDFSTKGANATQGHYANNSYFCTTATTICMSKGLSDNSTGVNASDWRTGGSIIDTMEGERLHEDGDIHAGTAAGVPFQGSKGYRHITNFGFNYTNLGMWLSQDTVLISEWLTDPLLQGKEHNKNRRGFVSFGDVTPPANVPTTGTAVYSGIVHGWYAATSKVDPEVIRGEATVTVDFSTREAKVEFKNPMTYVALPQPVPVALTTSVWSGAAGTNVANYYTGSVDNNGMKGGLSGRYYGPVISTGTSGTGPTEIGGAFRLTATSGATFIGGFIGRKQ